MSGAKGPNGDPSMDDILTSIRKIISDDEARAQVTASKAQPAGRDDVLVLTDLIAEPKAQASPAAPPALRPRIDPATAADMPQPSLGPPAGGTLIGPSGADVASSAFARLNRVLQDSAESDASVDPGPAMEAGGKTVEELVREMLRPMLKEWLDRNLPPLVERQVEREIARLTRR